MCLLCFHWTSLGLSRDLSVSMLILMLLSKWLVGDIVVKIVVILSDVDLVVEGNLEDRADEDTVDTFDVDIGVVLDFSVVNITDAVLGDEPDATVVTEVVIKVP